MYTNILKVLAIDDNRDTLASLKAVISVRIPGVTIFTAQDGKTGLELARAEDPDVILLDVAMPEMDGFAVCRALKADKALRSIPVLFVAASQNAQDTRAQALAAGAEGFLAKPFDGIVLTAQIRALAEIKAANRLHRAGKKELADYVAKRTQVLELELTEHKNIDEALIASEIRYRRLFESAKDGILIIDAESGVIVDVNPFLIDLTGYPHSEMLGKALWELGFLRDAVANQNNFRELLQQEYIRYDDLPLETASGRKVDVEFISNLYFVGDQKVIQCNIRDITERKQVKSELRRLNVELEDRVRQRTAELESTNGELESFTYSVSHDLRAPLRAIDGFTRILREEYAPRLDTEGQRVCGIIGDSTRRMGQLIDDLLAFSRLGRTEIRPATVEMTALAREIFLELTSPAERERIDFHLATLPTASGDPALLRQVWVNLLGNAIKFSAKKERATITVSAEHDGDETVFAVCDDGAGFDMLYANKLFGVFQRLHSEKEFTGTGLGLAIVQRIVQRHGGRIWANSTPDKGATFYFSMKTEGD